MAALDRTVRCSMMHPYRSQIRCKQHARTRLAIDWVARRPSGKGPPRYQGWSFERSRVLLSGWGVTRVRWCLRHWQCKTNGAGEGAAHTPNAVTTRIHGGRHVYDAGTLGPRSEGPDGLNGQRCTTRCSFRRPPCVRLFQQLFAQVTNPPIIIRERLDVATLLVDPRVIYLR